VPEDRVSKAEKPAREFIANVTHEVLTPLNAILGFAELMRDDEAEPLGAEQLEFIEDIHVSGEQLLSVINDSLDLIRGHVGSLELKALPTNLAHVIRSAEARVLAFAQELNVAVAVELPSSIGLVVADPDRVRSITATFLAEAIRYSPSGSTVSARVVSLGDGLVIQVDSPRSFSDEELDEVFVSVNRRRVGNRCPSFGTGLELPLATLLAAGMGARTAVERVDDKRIRYSLVFPMVLADVAPMDADSAIPHDGYVLIFDSCERSRRLAAATLEAANIETFLALTSADALISTHAETPIAAIVDGSEGADAYVRAIRMTAEFESLPILLWKGRDAPQRSADSLTDAVAEKGEGPAYLSAALNRLLSRDPE
jgi:hypothetical protein